FSRDWSSDVCSSDLRYSISKVAATLMRSRARSSTGAGHDTRSVFGDRCAVRQGARAPGGPKKESAAHGPRSRCVPFRGQLQRTAFTWMASALSCSEGSIAAEPTPASIQNSGGISLPAVSTTTENRAVSPVARDAPSVVQVARNVVVVAGLQFQPDAGSSVTWARGTEVTISTTGTGAGEGPWLTTTTEWFVEAPRWWVV